MTLLSSLDATFVHSYDDKTDEFHEGGTIDGAQGVMFVCPLCGHHQVLVWFKNPRGAPCVPPSASPGADEGKGPSRWMAAGSGLDDLTLTPSINLDTEKAREALKQGFTSCLWHGFVTNGSAA